MTVKLFDGLIEGEWPAHVSTSQRSAWMTCRLRTALSTAAHVRPREMGPGGKGMVVGNLVHSVLGQHYRAVPATRTQAKLHAWLDTTAHLNSVDAVLVGQAKARAHVMLDRFWNRYGNDGLVPQVEVAINRVLPSGIHYIGYADAVYEQDGLVVVEDWKTSLSNIEPTKHTVFNPQGRDYLWALTDRYPADRLVMSWLLMTPSSVRRIQTPIGNIVDVSAELDAIAREERTLEIVPNYDAKCMWCPYRALCETKLTGGDVKDTFERFYEVVKGGREEPEEVDET